MESDRKLPFLEHLAELRSRLIKSLIAIAVGMVVAFFFTRPIFDLLTFPLGPEREHLIYIELTEMFTTYLQVTLFFGIGLASPFVAYQIIAFVAPGLSAREKRYLFTLLPAVVFAFLVGGLVGYFVLVPPAVSFLLSFGTDIAQPQIRIGNYVSVVATLLFWVGVSFEVPIVLFILAKLRVVNSAWLARQWRYVLLLTFLAAALITPTPDPFNQTLMALPLLVLYGVSLLLTRLA